jgi:hypothetical protein
MKPNPKEINIILNILEGAQFEFLPRAPFYMDTPLFFDIHSKIVIPSMRRYPKGKRERILSAFLSSFLCSYTLHTWH